MANENTLHWDAFVSHAREDKETFVRPLVDVLGQLGVSLWYDEMSLRLGDSLTSSIDRGISKSQNGIVVVSPAFIQKNWPQAELHALMVRHIEGKLSLIPIWFNIEYSEVSTFSPLLADLVALQTSDRAVQDVALTLLAAIRPDLYELESRQSQLEKIVTRKAFKELEEKFSELQDKVSDLLCPTCKSPLSQRILSDDHMDPDQMDVEIFECGHIRGGHSPQACPFDPNFPELTDYEINCEEIGPEEWICLVSPKTPVAKRHHLSGARGRTKSEATRRLIEEYNRGAPSEKRVQ